ncbi:MAG: hypothetical protein AAB489_05010 [Patescibacteria group bacterium]
MQTQEFLSIKEAAERYSKAEITIRRFVRNVVKSTASHERKLIRPLPDEAGKLKKQKRPFTYTINNALLNEKFSAEAAPKSGKKTEIPPAEYMSLLERTNAGLLEQMNVKDDQIKALNSTLESLSERQRETNVLMKILEERLLLPSPAQAQTAARKRWWKVWKN